MAKILKKIYWWMTGVIFLTFLLGFLFDPRCPHDFGTFVGLPVCAMIAGAFLIIPVAVFFPLVVLFLPRRHSLHKEMMSKGVPLKGDEFDVFRRYR